MPTSKKTPVPAKRAKNAKTPVQPTPKPTFETPATSAPMAEPTMLPPAALTVANLLSAVTGASIAEVAEQTGLSRTTASKALAALENAGTARRENGRREGAHRAPDQWFAIARADTAPPVTTRPHQDAAPPAPAQPIDQDPQPEPPQDASTEPIERAVMASADGEPGEPSGDHAPPQGEPEPAPVGEPAPAHGPKPAASTPARPAKPAKKPPVTPAAPAAQTNGDERRLPKGGLRTMVADHLAGNPDLVITASKLGKLLDRSSGAVANALDKLIELGNAEQVGDKPRTFRYRAAEPSA